MYCWKENIPLSKLYKFRSVRKCTQRSYDSRYSGGQNSLVSSDMKSAGLLKNKVFDDIVGDLKIDALYI
jgi:hypothetical protein